MTSAAVRAEGISCLNCHTNEMHQFTASVHAQAGLNCVDREGVLLEVPPTSELDPSTMPKSADVNWAPNADGDFVLFLHPLMWAMR